MIGSVYDFTQIMHEYSKYVLSEFLVDSKNTFGKRFDSMIKEYVATDPRRQSRLDVYASRSENLRDTFKSHESNYVIGAYGWRRDAIYQEADREGNKPS